MKKNVFSILLLAIMVIIACNKNELTPPVSPGGDTPPDPFANKYEGTYYGIYEETNNGVGDTGVFEKDTSYAFTLKIGDATNQDITIRGLEDIGSLVVDKHGNFAFEDFNRTIEGNFKGDSLFLHTKKLSGTYTYPQYFVIQKLDFGGVKQE